MSVAHTCPRCESLEWRKLRSHWTLCNFRRIACFLCLRCFLEWYGVYSRAVEKQEQQRWT